MSFSETSEADDLVEINAWFSDGMVEICNRALKFYGLDHQMIKTVEELSELSQCL